MNSDYQTGKSQRRELHGPRPTPLKVRNNSHNIIKQPVIIYTVSPKIIHTDPSEFMTLVQRLTGSPNVSIYSDYNTELATPAARFASVEKIKLPKQKSVCDDVAMVDRSSFFPGILSPGPGALPIISGNFFSPPSDPNLMRFLRDLSPLLQGNKRYMGNNLLPSPSDYMSPYVSPCTPAMDLFNYFFGM